MVSAQMVGEYSFFGITPSGREIKLFGASSYFCGPGGSSEGVIANTPEKWNILPLQPQRFGPGSKFVIKFYGTAATTDASDSAMQIPLVINGQPAIIGNSAHATGIIAQGFTVTLAAADEAYLGSRPTPYLIYTANEGTYWQLGGNKMFVSIENNA